MKWVYSENGVSEGTTKIGYRNLWQGLLELVFPLGLNTKPNQEMSEKNRDESCFWELWIGSLFFSKKCYYFITEQSSSNTSKKNKKKTSNFT